ncbi:MAG: NAD-dependent methanol dehydrogenase [Chloroflexi bacterium ADurb.Bin180]|nr:MAG: NAD-dependent methanol dehydrogenase [Chloroflexi bacterium ADurb.Bin180]
MKTDPATRQSIARELELARRLTRTDILALVAGGQPEKAADDLVFFCPPDKFAATSAALRQELDGQFAGAAPTAQKSALAFLAHLTLDLGSLLRRWNLQPGTPGCGALTDEAVRSELELNLGLLGQWQAAAPAVASELLAEWQESAVARFRAEKAAHPEKMGARLAGASLVDYVRNVQAAVGASHVAHMAEERFAGLSPTEIGNDYASFLKYTMYLGASFVTTNPVLVDIAWNDDPNHWNPVMAAIVATHSRSGAEGAAAHPEADAEGLATHPEAYAEGLARLATMEVVLANMVLLRPIFLLTAGQMGSVSLQVNPKHHGDAEAMIQDATSLYEELARRIGGIPNLVFKLPATLGGLKACRVLTGKGIGVNITVNFGLFQLLRFAEVINDGSAQYSVLSEMNGRLAFPVRDELLAALPTLAALGITEADVREAAAWSAVIVFKRLHALMDEKGLDLARIKPLVASLRIYQGGPGYDRLPTPYPDVSETVGTRIITIFPNVRHAIDQEAELELHAAHLAAPVPEHVFKVLEHSELFKQAYYVADKFWSPNEDQRFRPARVLALEDEPAVAAWAPVQATLKEFGESYDRFVTRLVQLKPNKEPAMFSFDKAIALLREFKGSNYTFGSGVLDQVGAVTARLGHRAAFVYTVYPGNDVLIRRISNSLAAAGVEVAALIEGAAPNAPREDLTRITGELARANPDVIVVLGGGSTLDATKAAEVLRTLGGTVDDYFGTGKVTEKIKQTGKKLTPVVAIQTAASSGAHLTKYANITDVHSGQKKLIVDEAMVPTHALFDYDVTTSMPPGMTADGALDGLAHALEVLLGAVDKPYYARMQEVATQCIGLIVTYIERAIKNPNDKEARTALGLATDLGGYSIMLGGTSGAHLTSFSLVDILSHGRACAIMNPYYVVFFAPAVEEPLRLVGNLFRQAGYTTANIDALHGRELGVAVAEAMIALSQRIGFPTTLTEVRGFTPEHVTRALAAAKDPQLKMKLENMPVPLTAEMVDEYMGPILQAACDGDLGRIKNVA